MKNQRNDLLNPTLVEIFETFKIDKRYIKGAGSYLWDDQGNRYLDFIAQYGAIPFGYNPQYIWDAVDEVRQNQIPSFVQPSLPVEALRLANLLAQYTPGELCYCTFCQSGTEAVEAAIKLARSSTGKEYIISTQNSFHGKTFGSLSATGKNSYQKPFFAPAPGFMSIPFNDIGTLEKLLKSSSDSIAAFIVEPIQGEGGIIVAQPGYLAAAQDLCRKHNVIFIVDEIQTGLGRTGRLFACDHEGVEPDILVLAKALGGGILPIGVCISSPRIWNEDYGMLHSSTFANNNVTCAVGSAVLRKLLDNDQELIKEVEKKGQYLMKGLNRIAAQYPDVVKEVRGQGLMTAIEFNPLDDCGSYDMAYMADQGGFTILLAGFLLNVYNVRLAPYLNNSMTLRLEPTLTITYEEIDYVLNALDRVCHILHYRDYAKLYRYLINDFRRPGKITDFRPQIRKIKASHLTGTEKPSQKFAFVIHYPAPEDVIINNPSFCSFTRQELYDFMQWQSKTKEAGVVCHMPAIKSLDGTIAEGWLIGVPFGAREMMSLPRQETTEVIAQAVDLGRELGAQIVGLGALSSVVTKGGRSVLGRGVAITSGNSYTTLMAIEALFLGAQKMHIDASRAQGAVVGATGSIGRACAMLLAEQMTRITLLGNPKHTKSSRVRLESLVQEMFTYAWQRRKEKILSGLSLWLNQAIESLVAVKNHRAHELRQILLKGQEITLEVLEEVCALTGTPQPVRTSLSLEEALPECDMIVAASNSPEYLICSEHLKPGAVVCDVARPADVSPQVIKERNDVLILEGGLVQYPDNIAFGPNLGYRDGVNLACLSETVLLSMEGEGKDYSIGLKLPLEDIRYLRKLGQKHGFGLAGLVMGNREITDEEIAQIYKNSLGLSRAQNF
ncbi:MAG: aminotransferase class III-fold pyridoxal phosphate-dependent enzyme [Syntrophomonadaceae bacterium]|jgi:acetylornithine/succinyldiaminopimelate/putrescine aminotransferase/predicted amino acid dehydrogenase